MEKRDNRLTVKQSADFIGVHTNTIYEWIKEGKLRADKVGKSYKINHMDVLDIYSSKTRVDKDKEVLVSTQVVTDKAKDILTTKATRLILSMSRLIEEQRQYNENIRKEIFSIEENDKSKSIDIEKENNILDLMDSSRYKNIELLLNVREEIESFYKMCDFIDGLNQIYRYQDERRCTLDEELSLEKALRDGNLEYIINKVTPEDKLFRK